MGVININTKETSLKKLVLPLALLSTLAGCATGPRYTNYSAQDAACIKGDIANFIKFYSDGEAHVHIKEIDGVPTGGGDPYCLPPGKHRLGVYAANNYQIAQDYVDFEFGIGKKILVACKFARNQLRFSAF